MGLQLEEGGRITFYGVEVCLHTSKQLSEVPYTLGPVRGCNGEWIPSTVWNEVFEIPEGFRHNFLVNWGTCSKVDLHVLNSFWCASNPLPDDECESIRHWLEEKGSEGSEDESAPDKKDPVTLLLKRGVSLPNILRAELVIN